jgi:hypothetical protein
MGGHADSPDCIIQKLEQRITVSTEMCHARVCATISNAEEDADDLL